MDFTREPIIETVITPKEGFKIVVRSSKTVGQEEYFVDAVEVVSFGNAQFFRSLERPKSFLVPVNDYEVLEVREARMILKNVGLDRSIKIGGGREAGTRSSKEAVSEKMEGEPQEAGIAAPTTLVADSRMDKKRDKRPRNRRRKGRDELTQKTDEGVDEGKERTGEERSAFTEVGSHVADGISEPSLTTNSSTIASLLAPPPTLISETIARYKDNALFKGAFYTKEASLEAGVEGAREGEDAELIPPSIAQDGEEEGGYPSLDQIDEQIDQPAVPSENNNQDDTQ